MKTFTYNDIKVPKLGLGTWQNKEEDCKRAVKAALDMGYRHIDTAQAYDNEEHVGQGISESSVPREDVFVTTKIWRDKVAKDKLKPSLEESLKKLNTDYVDLVLLHWPVESVPLDEQLEALEDVQRKGMARLIGVSNYPVSHMKAVRETHNVDIATNQVEYHPFLSQEEVLNYIRANNMFLTAYSPLARGEVFENKTLFNIGEKHNLNAAQVAVLWEYQQDNVVTNPKSDNPDHIQDNLNAIEQTLSKEEMKKISELQSPEGRLIDPDFAPQWDAA